MFRFSLRSALLGIAVVAICLGHHMNQLRERRIAVAAIQNVGGQVFYCYQYEDPDERIWNSNPSPPGPAFARRIVGDDFFANVVGVCVTISDASGEQLDDLKVFRNAKWILLSHRFSQDEREELQRALPNCKVEP